jgi:hypothetical protein
MMHQDSRLRSGQLVALPFVALLLVAKLFVSERSVWAQEEDELNCKDFPSQAAAQREYQRDRSDPNNLDADNDGQACEDFDYGGSGARGAPDTQYRDGRAEARGAADNQYRKAVVIVETIPKKKLPDTSGPP